MYAFAEVAAAVLTFAEILVPWYAVTMQLCWISRFQWMAVLVLLYVFGGLDPRMVVMRTSGVMRAACGACQTVPSEV